jgi:putative transposase
MRTRLLALLLAATSLPALAEDPCAAEAARHCSRAKGEVALLGCLRGHDKEVSPACRAELSALLEIAEEYGKDCEADAKRLKALEKENAELKKMYAEAMLGNKILREALGKKL